MRRQVAALLRVLATAAITTALAVAPILLAIRQLGPDLLTGGTFGPEAGRIGVAASLVGIAILYSARAAVLSKRTFENPMV